MSIRDRSPIRRDADGNSNIRNMAEISQIEMNMAKEMLPEYSGGSKNLAYFIRQVESYLSLLRKPDVNCLFNRLLFEQVKAKLVGEARDVLISSDCCTWSQIKDTLLQRFGDPRSEELLLNDLATCYQLHNESYETYFERLKHKLQVLLEHVSIRTPNNDIRISKENMYTNQALSVFKSGVLEPYCSHLLNLPINSLEQALYECRKYDNNKAQISFMNFMRSKSKINAHNNNSISKPSFKQGKINYQPRPSLYYPNNFGTNNVFDPHSNSNNNNFGQTTQTSQFPRGPINMPNQQKVPANFNIKKDQKYTPTPMSTTTRNSFSRQRPTPMSTSTKHNFKQNYFQPQSRPTFISEELFNVESPQENDIPYNEYECPFPYDEQEQEHPHIQENYAESPEEAENFRLPASEIAE